MTKLYSLSACEKLMAQYYDIGGDYVTVQEGNLGMGTVVCWADGYKVAVIQERYLSEWASSHTIRFYNAMPDKYQKLIDKALAA